MSSTIATHGVMFWVLSSIIIIAQSDTIKIEYVIGWSKKISLSNYFLSEVIFPSLYPFSGTFFRDFFGKN